MEKLTLTNRVHNKSNENKSRIHCFESHREICANFWSEATRYAPRPHKSRPASHQYGGRATSSFRGKSFNSRQGRVTHVSTSNLPTCCGKMCYRPRLVCALLNNTLFCHIKNMKTRGKKNAKKYSLYGYETDNDVIAVGYTWKPSYSLATLK